MITIVVPWYGPDTRGGAENQARSLARALHARGVPVRVWASIGRDSFQPGAPGQVAGSSPHYPAGHTELDGIPLWRFRPSPPDAQGVPRFFLQHTDLLPWVPSAGPPFAPHEMELLRHLLSSDELYAAILAERERTRFIFLPYPFPTSFWGALVAAEAGYLLPCLHDEPYARYSTYRHLFTRVRGVLANSHAEADFARRLYGLAEAQVWVAGEGIDLTPRGEAARFWQGMPALADKRDGAIDSGPASQSPHLLLYTGRREEGKNIPLLLAYVREYWARRGTPLLLLMAGQNQPDLPWTMFDTRWSTDDETFVKRQVPIVSDRGFLDEQSKHDAYAAADVFVQPSLHESFSIVLMEAWLQGTPALVHGDCAVTADHARRSGGGLAFRSFGEFAAALDLLLPNATLRRSLGEHGRRYVLETCRWDEVARRTAAFVLGS